MFLNRMRRATLAFLAGLAVMGSGAVAKDARDNAQDRGGSPGKIVVADRASGTISVINTGNDELLATVALPAAANPPEPMYVFYSPIRHRVFVGDRANDRVVAFDGRTFEVTGTIPTGRGVFHMWGSIANKQLWVNCDVDNVSTVIDMRTLEVIATVPTPPDLVAMGGKPHDVILVPTGSFAYATVLGLPGPSDYLVQYDTATFTEMNRVAVGKDPHVSLTLRNNLIYVPCQGSDVVQVFDRTTLAPVTDIAIPGAHGAGMTRSGRYFYTTNLPGGGTDALWTIETDTNTLVGQPVDSPYGVPHNIALTPNGGKLYLTHSGMNDKVTVYTTTPQDPTPAYLTEVTVGMNPFGLAYVP